MFSLFSSVIFLFGMGVYAYIPHVPVNIYSRCFLPTIKGLEDIQVFEPYQVNRSNTECLVFFTGGSSVITYDIYSNLLNEVAGKNISVYIPSFRYNDYDKLIQVLSKEYKEVIGIGHSSGSSTLIQKFGDKKNVQRIILMDPVDTRIVKVTKNDMKNVQEVLFLNAQKSYQGNPIPFIPDFLKLEKKDFNFAKGYKYRLIESAEFGHCDILNPIYSNFMFYSKVCNGNLNRKITILNQYHRWISEKIYNFVKRIPDGDDIDEDGDSDFDDEALEEVL